MKATAKALIGRTITAVEFNAEPDGKGGKMHNPVITLDNGRRLFFATEETEVGEYGTDMRMTPVPKQRRLRVSAAIMAAHIEVTRTNPVCEMCDARMRLLAMALLDCERGGK